MDEFLRNLRSSNLLTIEQWEAVRREATGGRRESGGKSSTSNTAVLHAALKPEALADRLVERGLITRWQASMLIQGKKAFFLGKYRLLDCIGSGGMGAVFKARHGELGRNVAIKIMSAAVVKNRRAVARFHKEMQAVAALDDPHIVAAYDAHSAGGVHYLVMEYVDGEDLGRLVKHFGPLPIDFACECIRQAAQGLQHAHQQGMVHRDIKPTNLLVARDPESGGALIKILDLGLARFVSESVAGETVGGDAPGGDGSLTQIGQFLGTPDYISPEQAQDTRAADIRSDIFSLGCTLFRLLTGELAYSGETVVQKLEARETQETPHVRTKRVDVPPELDAVVARMLARDPRSRFQTPREVAQALAPFAAHATPMPAPASKARSIAPDTAADGPPATLPAEDTRMEQFFRYLKTTETDEVLTVAQITRRLRRVPRRAWLAAAGFLVVAVGGVLMWERLSAATLVVDWPLDQREGAELYVGARPYKLPGRPKIAVNGRAGNWELRLVRDGFEKIQTTLTLQSGERRDFAPIWVPTPRTLRRQELARLKDRAAGPAGTDVASSGAPELRRDLALFLQEHPASHEAADAWKMAARLRWPLDRLDASRIASEERSQFSRVDGAAEVVALFGDSRLKFWNSVTAVATSGDGRTLAATSLDGTVQVFDFADGRRLHTFEPPTVPTDLAFSPNGPTLAVAGTAGPVTLWNVAEGHLVTSLADAFAPIAFSHDGRLIATRATRQEIALFDADTGALRRTLQGHSTGVLLGLSFSHAGRMLASYGSDASVLLWDVASGQERRRFPQAQRPLFSPDDAFLAAGATDGDLKLWDTRTGETLRILDEGGYPLAFSADGAKVVSKRLGRAIVWDLVTGDEIRTLVEVPELAAVSSDGNWLAGGDDNFGELRLWNLPAGILRHTAATAGPVASLAFSADSSTVVTGSRAGIVEMRSVESGAERVPASPPLGPADLSPDGRLLAVSRAGRIELIDITTGESRLSLAGNVPELDSLIFSPDGRTIAGFGGWGFFKTSLKLWNSVSGEELILTDDHAGTVRTMAFSADSKFVASAGDSRMVTIWDVARRTVHDTLDEFSDRVLALAFHPEGRRLAGASQDRRVVLWDVKAKKGTLIATPGAVCRQLVFSRDGKLLAAATDDEALIWDVEHGKIVAELSMAGGSGSIAFHPAGNMLAAAGSEGKIWLWNDPARDRDRDEPDRVISVGPARGVVKRVLWSIDGRHLVTVNGNGTVYVLRLKP